MKSLGPEDSAKLGPVFPGSVRATGLARAL